MPYDERVTNDVNARTHNPFMCDRFMYKENLARHIFCLQLLATYSTIIAEKCNLKVLADAQTIGFRSKSSGTDLIKKCYCTISRQ